MKTNRVEQASVGAAKRPEITRNSRGLVVGNGEDVGEAARREGCGGLGADTSGRTDRGQEGAAGGEGRDESGTGLRLRSRNSAVTGCEEDGDSPGAELHVGVAKSAFFASSGFFGIRCDRGKHVLGDSRRDVWLIKSIAGGQNLGWRRLADKGIYDVEETVYTVRIILANGNKCGRDACGNTNGILDVQVLQKESNHAM
jgi:hypothetical protein